MSTGRDEAIERLKAKIVKEQEPIGEMNEAAEGECCAQCMFGGAFTDLVDVQGRRKDWLRILLAKRGTPDDLYLAESIRVGAWP